ncbi:MAG TPA: HNH endonuclease [Sunxiuqinia sp.]|nr:HNH endonuclease [Sunxiuqinia sp.]
MKEKDIKILWGRSGNRCAICQVELTPDGDKETLGEMAHIVAKSGDGPRGATDLPSGERDRYRNLILLCPTHHCEIDKNFHDWPVSRLEKIKTDHEHWVSEQLGNGKISVRELDNSKFFEERQRAYMELARNHIALVASLTPLRVSAGQIDTMEPVVQSLLEKAIIPGNDIDQKVNSYHTRPSEFGLVNEIFRELPKRTGHSYHIFESGHCEYFNELGSDTDRITQYTLEKGEDIKGASFVIRYTDVAEAIDRGITWLSSLWANLLPFEYLEFRCQVLNCKNSTLFSYEDDWKEGVFGYPTRSESLIYSDVLTRDTDFEHFSFDVLRWLAKCYGLVLHSKLDLHGKYRRPVTMR